MYLLGRYGGWFAQQKLWEYVDDEVLQIRLQGESEQGRMHELMDRYQDCPMDLADASLVAAAEALNESLIFTLDGDFYIYRLANGRAFEVIPK